MRTFCYLSFLLLLISCKNDKSTDKPKADNWVLIERNVFKNVLSKEGYIDTVYRTKYAFDKGVLMDSAYFTSVFAVKDGKVTESKYYQVDKNSTLKLMGAWKFGYDKNGNMISSAKNNNGILEIQEKNQFDDSGRLVKSFGTEMIYDRGLDLEDEDQSFKQIGTKDVSYNTINVSYEYDKQNNLVRAVTTDKDNQLVRTNVNLYTGGEPIVSYRIDAKGDTVQNTNYAKDGKLTKVIIENDSLKITKLFFKTWLVAQITEDLKANKQWKRVVKYDLSGRKKEQSLYYNDL
jgi:hypothetical protein